MKCSNYLNIRIPEINYSGFNSKPQLQKHCVSFDTETRKGKPFLLCDSNGNVITEHKDMVDHLLSQKDTLNTFYNLQYDKNAILKTLSKDALRFFAKYEYCIEDNIYFGGIGAKSFELAYCIPSDLKKKTYIDHEGNEFSLSKKVKFFDTWQFFKFEKSAKLDDVSKKYLNDQKVPITDLGYDITNLPLDQTVIDYCIHDAELTKRLTDIIINSCNDIGMLFNAPYSCATLSADYFYKTVTDIKPFVIPNPKRFLFNFKDKTINSRNYDICYYAYNSYAGGRTEVTKKGMFENAHCYDVTSMYPYQMTLLEDCGKLFWKKITTTKELIDSGIDNIAYGFFRVNIKIPESYILPLPIRQNVLKYVYGDLQNQYCTLEELKTIVELDILDYEDIEILSGWIGIRYDDNEMMYPFRDTINLLFEQRSLYSKDDFRNLLFKILLNSIYGRFIEVNANYEVSKDIDASNYMDYDITSDDVCKKTWTCGNYFNPIYAAYITAKARCYLFNAAKQKEDAFIACFTDSVMSEDKLDLPEGKKLGQWEYEKGDLFMIGTGFYTFDGVIQTETKFRTRGVHVTKENKNDKLTNIDFDNIFRYGYKEKRVRKLKESVIQDRLDDFNCFEEKVKMKDINFDQKRKWDFDYKSIEEIRQKQCNSKPLKIQN